MEQQGGGEEEEEEKEEEKQKEAEEYNEGNGEGQDIPPEEEIPIRREEAAIMNYDEAENEHAVKNEENTSLGPETQTEPLGEENKNDCDEEVKTDYDRLKEMEGTETANGDIYEVSNEVNGSNKNDSKENDGNGDDSKGNGDASKTEVSVSQEQGVVITIGASSDIPSGENGNIEKQGKVVNTLDDDGNTVTDSVSIVNPFEDDMSTNDVLLHNNNDDHNIDGSSDDDNRKPSIPSEEKGNEKNWREMCDAKPPIVYLDDIDLSGYKTWTEWADVLNILRGEYDAHVRVSFCFELYLICDYFFTLR